MHSFQDVLRVHDALRERLFAHQRALLDREIDAAAEALLHYRRELIAHMRDEEELLLPIYRRGEHPPNAAPDLYVHEHRVMLRRLDVIEARLAAVPAPEHDGFHGALLAVLDEECRYKAFVEHHEGREERWLFPGLDSLASAAEKADLVPRLLQRSCPQQR